MCNFKTILLFSILCLIQAEAFCQPKTDALLGSILERNKNSALQEILSDPSKFRCQIIYTRIDRDRNNRPHFKNYYFNYDPLLYFNPASTVKMPLAYLSLQKLKQMSVKGVDKQTPLQIDSSFSWQKP